MSSSSRPPLRYYSFRARLLVVLVGLLLWGGIGQGPRPANGQAEGSAADALTSSERPIRIRLQPTYQRYEDGGRTVTEWSAPLVAVVPFRERWQVSIRGSGASATGDNLATLTGLSDIRAALSYTWPLGDGSLILNASVNAPVGKEELTDEEFGVARVLSRNFYQFRVPSFGQGFGASTGATWAIPVTESVVVGVGGVFRYHGSYTPSVNQQEQYDPGEEGRLTGGLDIRLSPASALSTDISYFLYGPDTVGGTTRFEVGNQITARVQYLRETDQRTIRLVGRYLQHEKSTLPLRTGADRTLQILPTRAVLRGQYRTSLTERVELGVSAAGRWYEETASFESKTLVSVGVAPSYEVTEGFRIAPRAEYTGGSVSGIEGGLGILAQF